MMIPRDRAFAILDECTGDTIWSVDHCRLRRVPEAWIEQFADAFESNPDHDASTIYVGDRATNQYHGVRDVDLAKQVAISLGINIEPIEDIAATRSSLVAKIKDAVEEG